MTRYKKEWWWDELEKLGADPSHPMTKESRAAIKEGLSTIKLLEHCLNVERNETRRLKGVIRNQGWVR